MEKSILIVDNCQETCKALRMALERDYTVSLAATGEDGFKNLSEKIGLAHGEKNSFSPISLSYHHPYHCRSFVMFRCQSSLHQSPIRIKAIGVKFYPLTF